MKVYKFVNTDLKCFYCDFQYEIGKSHKVSDYYEVQEKAFRGSRDAYWSAMMQYASLIKYKYLLLELEIPDDTPYIKRFAHLPFMYRTPEMTVIRIVPEQEMWQISNVGCDLTNYGIGNCGKYNIGDFNLGFRNRGKGNIGNDNVGDWNVGTKMVGYYQSESGTMKDKGLIHKSRMYNSIR